ncbi:Cysteine rich receptor like kinase [Parasponia andersonii]|uniref:Cysteine rich receptor like kinase n=1 Tax=Parasponia andersonii TaxID=3476 RepID=A0A2P5AZQ7_PARAD|nr:Cysteine rich receptor like kinase [Parasponia andersonii]
MAYSSFLYLVFALMSHISLSSAFQDYLCTNQANYTSNSSFEANLKATLSSLRANSRLPYGFHNTSAGQGPDRVNGLFLCRGDISPAHCQSCVKVINEAIIKLCPKQKEAILWFDHCMLRYSNRSIFSVMEDTPKLIRPYEEKAKSPKLVQQALNSLLEKLVPQALSSPKLFAIGRVEHNLSLGSLYGLVQCTQDITKAECRHCLSMPVADMTACCYGGKGGRILKPSCTIRYGNFPFNESSPASLAPPPLIRPSPPTSYSGKWKISKEVWAVLVTLVLVMLLSSLVCYLFGVQKATEKQIPVMEGKAAIQSIKATSSLQYDLGIIKAATNHFSDANRIGEGGFGRVYKGKLKNGQVIAVKRLASSSGQGAEEFINEVTLLAKLQDQNLVRLLGFCLERQEKILIYEFVPNKSLDYFLYRSAKQGQLDWQICYKILRGIARGLLYLHQESRMKVVHRDLKPSNVLLDADMTPKISDFGIARLFDMDQSHGNTSRVVGTFGYMSPEYAMHGEFSVKSDVFSFGVIILETVSGKRNCGFDQYSCDGEDLLSYAWRQWRAGTPLELMHPNLTTVSDSKNEVARCIQIGLLCVQEDPADRPEMSVVVFMLQNVHVALPLPKQPPWFLR